MSILSSICEENNAIKTGLDRFITNYDYMPDEKRIQDIGHILDLLHHILESNQEDSFLVTERNPEPIQPEARHLLKAQESRYKSIESILEKMQNIHVDEPNNEFKARAEQLRNLLDEEFCFETEHRERRSFT